jgi:penicillin amidase
LWLVGILPALAMAAAFGLIVWFNTAAHDSLPQVDGSIPVRGLQARVTVIRDAQGVPQISAANLEDLFFAQGYVTAQDRLWEMDMTRRFAAGELAEILGSKYLEQDRRQRTLLMRPLAENGAALLSPRDRAFFEAYARGVNAYIVAQKHLPIEFRVLAYQPRPWTVADSFLVAASMIETLNLDSLPHVLAREKITARLPPELAADLYPNSSWRDHPPVSTPGQDDFVPSEATPQIDEEEQPPPPTRRHVPAHSQRRPAKVAGNAEVAPASGRLSVRTSRPHHNSQTAGVDTTRTAGQRPALPQDALLFPGSNNWVLSGAHTVSGKPLLANDMHLEHRLPNVWYEAHLTSGTLDVAGITLPGFPFVLVGHNQRIAWGFTNLGPAVADLFVETFNDRHEYQTPEGWRQPEHRQEVIHVRGHSDVSLDVLITRHGPIISPLIPGETRSLALKWVAHDPAALQVPLFDMDSAQNWDEFRQALRRFTSPAQNVVYADVDGHIGYQATGLIPIRVQGDGTLPVSGADNAHEWTGYIPFDRLPSAFDPPSGILATANGRITPDGYPYLISNEWGPPYRTARIYHALDTDRKFAPADMLALQNDVYSDFDRFCADRFVYAIDHAAKPSPQTREAAERMRAWDGQITAGSTAATLVANSRRELVRRLLQPKLGEMWTDYQWFMSPVWLENLLLHQPERWLPPDSLTWDELLTSAVDDAASHPPSSGKLKDWHWQAQPMLSIEHPLFGRLPWLGRRTGTGRVPQSGNGYTVKQVGAAFGPSERMTVDLSNLDNSTLNIVNGQSGQIFSPHYMDQWPAWRQGTTFSLPFSPAAVDKAKVNTLTLQPD